MYKTRIVLLTAILLAGLTVSIAATIGGPLFWRVDTFAEVEKGELKGLSVAANGAVTLASELKEVFDTKQAYIWAATADRAGNVYLGTGLGTGNEGRIYKVDPTGKGTLLFQAPELSVMALAVDGEGSLYAGTSPDGKVYRITPGGEAKPFFEPKAKYIWSLAFDSVGRLLVATGDKGILYRVTPDGKGAPLVTVAQANLTTIMVAGDGSIIAGTDPGGMVLRISPEGRLFTLFDSDQREIRALAAGRDGTIYALALAESAGSGATNGAAPPATPVSPVAPAVDGSVTVTISDLQVVDSPGASSTTPAASTGGQAKSVLYKISGEAGTEAIWESRDAAAFAIHVNQSGSVLIGTGQKGRIYGVRPDRSPVEQALLGQLPEAQTSRFVRAGEKLYLATSNLGKLYALSSEGAEGSLTSTIYDSQHHASWGRLSWTGEGRVELQSRSGNTAIPDSTWSDWSAPILSAEGEAIKSPPARYLQWRATLRRQQNGPAPLLREVTASILPRNLAPRVHSISVLPVGVALQAIPQQSMEGVSSAFQSEAASITNAIQMPPRRLFQRGAISLQWQADDRNGDQLTCSLLYRNAAGGDLHLLKEGLRENFYTIDSNELPDGRYIFKVRVTDLDSNPRELALGAEIETEPVYIDNSAPTVTFDTPTIEGRSVLLPFRAVDTTSLIRRAEYQLDGGGWAIIFPVDRIADSRQEEYRLKFELPDANPHTIAVRVFDANSNIGGAQTVVKGR